MGGPFFALEPLGLPLAERSRRCWAQRAARSGGGVELPPWPLHNGFSAFFSVLGADDQVVSLLWVVRRPLQILGQVGLMAL